MTIGMGCVYHLPIIESLIKDDSVSISIFWLKYIIVAFGGVGILKEFNYCDFCRILRLVFFVKFCITELHCISNSTIRVVQFCCNDCSIHWYAFDLAWLLCQIITMRDYYSFYISFGLYHIWDGGLLYRGLRTLLYLSLLFSVQPVGLTFGFWDNL